MSSGGLLVSRSFATFCRVSASQLEALGAVLRGESGLESLDAELRADLGRHGFFSAPRPRREVAPALKLQLTNACNLACDYCCTGSGRARGPELERADWVRAIDEGVAVAGPSLEVGLLGGEPLLAPHALEVAAHALERGARPTLFTNGILLADAAVSRGVADLVRRGAQVRVSLAAPGREPCDRLSRGPRFDAALAGLASLAAHGASARVDLMLFPETVAAVAAELPALRARLPPGSTLALGVAFCGGREQGVHLFASRGALEAALDRIALEAGEAVPAPSPSPLAPRREACDCALGLDLAVRSDGRLFACFRMEEPVGEFPRQSLAAVWRGLRRHPRPALASDVCRDCPLASLCGGGCRADNLLFTGDGERPWCGPWRVRLLAELLAEDRVASLEWPTAHLVEEARRRGIDVPAAPSPRRLSLHLLE